MPTYIENQRARLEELEAKKQEILDTLAPIEKKRDALSKKIGPLEAERRELGREATQIERDGNLREISIEIAAIHRALGAKSIKAEAGEYGATT